METLKTQQFPYILHSIIAIAWSCSNNPLRDNYTFSWTVVNLDLIVFPIQYSNTIRSRCFA